MVFLQPVHQIPDARLIPLMTVDHTVVIEHFNLIQQFQQPFPDLRMAQDILKNIAAESRHRRVRRQAHHDPAQQLLLLGLGRHLFRQRVQAKIVPAFLRDFPVCNPVLPGEQNTQFCLFHFIILIFRIPAGSTPDYIRSAFPRKAYGRSSR